MAARRQRSRRREGIAVGARHPGDGLAVELEDRRRRGRVDDLGDGDLERAARHEADPGQPRRRGIVDHEVAGGPGEGELDRCGRVVAEGVPQGAGVEVETDALARLRPSGIGRIGPP